MSHPPSTRSQSERDCRINLVTKITLSFSNESETIICILPQTDNQPTSVVVVLHNTIHFRWEYSLNYLMARPDWAPTMWPAYQLKWLRRRCWLTVWIWWSSRNYMNKWAPIKTCQPTTTHPQPLEGVISFCRVYSYAITLCVYLYYITYCTTVICFRLLFR